MATKKQLADAKKLLEQTKARQKELDAQLAKANQTAAANDPLANFLNYAKTRGEELDALTLELQSKNPTPLKPVNQMSPEELKALQIARVNAQKEYRETGGGTEPPYVAPEGSYWRFVGNEWRLYKKTPVSSNQNPIVIAGGSQTGTTGGGTDAKTLALIESLQQQIAALTNQQTKADAEAKAAAAKAAESQRQSIISVLTSRFGQYGLGSLVNKIKELAVDGATEATITLALQETEEYKQRFAANQDRIKKGLAVLSPAEYLASEDAYRQTLRAYGLTQFDNDQYVRQFISNDVSPQELSSRVSIAVQRVQNADPAVTKTLRDYYGIGVGDMVGYILDPNQALPKIQQQVAAAEIGTAARRQGLEAGVTVAEQLARQGITEAEAQKGYATIADILPSAEKLSQIYGTSLEEYGQTEAEQEVFNSLASAQRKRRALTAREVATFSGSSGTGRGSLGTSTAGQIQNPDTDLSAPCSVEDRQQEPVHFPEW